MFYSEADTTFKLASRTGIRQGTLEIVIEEVFCRYGDLIKQLEVPISRMLNDILKPNQIQWQPSTDQTLYQSVNFLPNSTFYRLMRGFHKTCWEQSFSRTCIFFSGLFTSNIPRYFLDFAFIYRINSCKPLSFFVNFFFEFDEPIVLDE